MYAIKVETSYLTATRMSLQTHFLYIYISCFQGPEGKPGIEGRPGIPASKVCKETVHLYRERVFKRRITPSSRHAVLSNYIIKRQYPNQHDSFQCGRANPSSLS